MTCFPYKTTWESKCLWNPSNYNKNQRGKVHKTLKVKKCTMSCHDLCKIRVKTDMVNHFADLWLWLVLQIGPLRPIERDGASGLGKTEHIA